ncbi:cysteine protease, putative [Medicago truncatula]|uniref:Cysteine protease, putative n=1 Tax=Medicago truncatula TaxID=3880 RepID=G7KU66_MEDTR|nr:cysteine protease, putative [Medicago truncatula]
MTNMTIFMSPGYSCLRICNVDDAKVIVIDRICTCSKLIFQPESNEPRTKTENQNKQSRSETMKSQKQTKENRKYVK